MGRCKGKTDIQVVFLSQKDELRSVNFSLKIASSMSNFVTCHQYPVEAFVEELAYKSRKGTREILTEGLEDFAEYGAWYGVRNIDQFLPCLQNKMKRLFDWAVAGKSVHSSFNSGIVQALVLTQECKTQGRYKYEVFSVDEYRRLLFQRGWRAEARKGYPFNWTRHSKHKKDIVLKMPLIF